MALLTISLDKITHNTRQLNQLCEQQGIAVSGVTKGVWGDPAVARAMLAGGIKMLAESRLKNISRLRAAGIDCPLWLLRIPALSEVEHVVSLADLSLNSEFAVIAALSEAAVQKNKRHAIILMVELGDLREGILPRDLPDIVARILKLPGIQLMGLGTNLSCYGGIIPTPDNLGQLVSCAEEIEAQFAIQLRYISGGNSSSLPLLVTGEIPARINHLRLGEAILLGRETIKRQPLDDTWQDAFLIEAEIIEQKKKASVPSGKIGEDAFGNIPQFQDKGEQIRAIVNLGRADTDITGITPVAADISIIGASSDHLIVTGDSAPETRLAVGKKLSFSMNYAALLAATPTMQTVYEET